MKVNSMNSDFHTVPRQVHTQFVKVQSCKWLNFPAKHRSEILHFRLWRSLCSEFKFNSTAEVEVLKATVLWLACLPTFAGQWHPRVRKILLSLWKTHKDSSESPRLFIQGHKAFCYKGFVMERIGMEHIGIESRPVETKRTKLKGILRRSDKQLCWSSVMRFRMTRVLKTLRMNIKILLFKKI